jgi:hypothetical protein
MLDVADEKEKLILYGVAQKVLASDRWVICHEADETMYATSLNLEGPLTWRSNLLLASTYTTQAKEQAKLPRNGNWVLLSVARERAEV